MSWEISRRDFLDSLLRAGVAATALHAAGDLWSAADPRLLGKERMIVRSLRFFDLEMPVEQIRTWITPLDLFFVRNHVFEPTTFDPKIYRLHVSGEVERPLELTLTDLRRMESAAVVNTLECAGNGRRFYHPHVPGIQWGRGAVGTARFAGPRLRDVLNRAGLKSTAKHVAFRGMDEAPGKVPQFIRSIPIQKALDPDTLLATHMNSMPLPKHHGRPVRVLVPGWVGAASVKWVTEITVLPQEFEGNFMKPGYRLPVRPIAPGEDVRPEDTRVITVLNVKSVVARPAEGARLRMQAVVISGAAWAGEADVKGVEVSTDGGSTWHPAQFGAERARYAWRLWHYPWKPQGPGEYEIRVRATDTRGRTQPERPNWNPSGYLWNGIERVRVTVDK